MRMQRLWGMVGVVTCLMLVASVGAAAEPAPDEQSLANVRAQIQAYERVWNTHDADQLAAFFTDDADLVMGNDPRISGRESISGWWGRYFAAISPHRVVTIEVETLRLLTPEVALANVNTLTAGRDEKNAELPARRARGMWVLIARNGQWLISALRGLPAEGDMRVAPGKDR